MEQRDTEGGSVAVALPVELEARLRREAERLSRTVPEVIAKALDALAEATEPAIPTWIAALTPEERAARVDAAYGALAHIPITVDEFLREKHAEAEEEEERLERYWAGEDR